MLPVYASERLEALAYVALLATTVRAIIHRRARWCVQATNEEFPLPGKRTTKRSTTHPILGSFDDVVGVIRLDGTRAWSESKLFPGKMFRALGVSLSIYVTIPRETLNPRKPSG